MAKRMIPVMGKREWKRLIKEYGTDQAIADHFGVTRQTIFLNRKKVLSSDKPVIDKKSSKPALKSPKVKKVSIDTSEPQPAKTLTGTVKKAKKEIRAIELFKKGKKVKEIAQKVGLSGSYVYKILSDNIGSVKSPKV